MPSVVKDTEWPSCGHRYDFGLPVGDVIAGVEYGYVCPVSGARTALRPASAGEPAPVYPQGAVQLEPPQS